MAASNGITLKDLFSDESSRPVALKTNDGIVSVFSAPGGAIEIYKDGVKVFGVNENKPLTAVGSVLKAGIDLTPDHWLYVGVSEDPESPRFRRPMYLQPKGDVLRPEQDTIEFYANDWLKTGRRKTAGHPTLVEQQQVYQDVISKGLGEFNIQSLSSSPFWVSSTPSATDGALCGFWVHDGTLSHGLRNRKFPALFRLVR